MNIPVGRLPANARRGSKLRCHLLTHGTQHEVSERLTNLIKPFGLVRPDDEWMPQGFDYLKEAQLHNSSRLLPPRLARSNLQSWWLACSGSNPMTPNWDIASTCLVRGQKGLLLIEAKAHEVELNKEMAGKKLKSNPTDDSLRNHKQSAQAIEEANMGLSEVIPGWKLSRDSHYQMSNRFSWAWKLADLGIPVVLVYLGFLNADEMADIGNPFATYSEWKNLVTSHSKPLFPAAVWNQQWKVGNQFVTPLIRSLEWQL